MTETVIEVVNLRKVYGPTVAVADVSFEVRRGEIVGIIGPNGAGKTTTIECVEGQRRPDAGQVRVLGQDPQDRAALLRERIGVQLQAAALPPRIKVWEAIELFASFYRRPLDGRRLLEEMGLGEKTHSLFMKLSGGQRQRLFIALALINDPELLFLDELTTGLDPQGRRMMWDLIRGIRARGKTILLTTHYMEEAERLCDRVAIVDHGRIIALDTPRNLVRLAPFETRITFQVENGLDTAALAALEAVTRVERQGDEVVVYAGDGALGRLVRALETQGCRFRELRTQSSSLEEVFLGLTGREMRD
jgi:ABC-2 type transport system ATP-binding protein